MTVFQAQNAYGHGCPWRCSHAKPVVYRVADYPVAQRHAETHFGMTTPLRAPNGPDVAERVGEAFQKVFANVGNLAVE